MSASKDRPRRGHAHRRDAVCLEQAGVGVEIVKLRGCRGDLISSGGLVSSLKLGTDTMTLLSFKGPCRRGVAEVRQRDEQLPGGAVLVDGAQISDKRRDQESANAVVSSWCFSRVISFRRAGHVFNRIMAGWKTPCSSRGRGWRATFSADRPESRRPSIKASCQQTESAKPGLGHRALPSSAKNPPFGRTASPRRPRSTCLRSTPHHQAQQLARLSDPGPPGRAECTSALAVIGTNTAPTRRASVSWPARFPNPALPQAAARQRDGRKHRQHAASQLGQVEPRQFPPQGVQEEIDVERCAHRVGEAETALPISLHQPEGEHDV